MGILTDTGKGQVTQVKAARPTGNISDAFGSLKAKKKGRTLSIEDMNEVIARGWAGKR